MSLRVQRKRRAGVQWAWVPIGLFGLVAAWLLGGWFRIGLVAGVAVCAVVFVARHRRR